MITKEKPLTQFVDFTNAIADKLISKGIFNEELFNSNNNMQRVGRFWNAGETPDSAAETLSFFFEAKKRPLVRLENAKKLALSYNVA